MISEVMMEKLAVLADAAKYDVSCASSGVDRKGKKGLGNATAAGICHTWASDGRCVSLLKILMTNDCIYDCAYCTNRVTNNRERASFTPEEIATLTMEFYRRNYIEGLFLSSAVEGSPNRTMERLVKVLEILRNTYGFAGYIHVKAIPGADLGFIRQAGFLADRMSANIELATKEGLRMLAPQKPLEKLVIPMQAMHQGILQIKDERKHLHHTPAFIPAGQSTQIIVGAVKETDYHILRRSDMLYKTFSMKRVYYSAYMPVNTDKSLPSVQTRPPLLREHRLYQADWLLRFYKFDVTEILDESSQELDLDLDPKMIWALRHIDEFPVEVNKATYEKILRIPGIGVTSALRIVKQRRINQINYDDLKKMGVVLKRARFFLTCQGYYYGDRRMDADYIKEQLCPKPVYHQIGFDEIVS